LPALEVDTASEILRDVDVEESSGALRVAVGDGSEWGRGRVPADESGDRVLPLTEASGSWRDLKAADSGRCCEFVDVLAPGCGSDDACAAAAWRSSERRASALNTFEQRPQRT
jgi:hypothetical protein